MEKKKGFIIVSKEVLGDVNIAKNTQFNKIKAKNVIIEENVTARLFGDVSEKITLKKGSKLYIHGTVTSNIENEGGELNIYR